MDEALRLVGYESDGRTRYFVCGADSDKAANLAGNDRISLTIDHDTSPAMEMTRISMSARPRPVVHPAEREHARRMLMQKHPPQSRGGPASTPPSMQIFRVTLGIALLSTQR